MLRNDHHALASSSIVPNDNAAADDDDWETHDPSARIVLTRIAPASPSATNDDKAYGNDNGVVAATNAISQLRILQTSPSPPSHLDSTPTYEHAFADAQPVSAATASAAASAHAHDGVRNLIDPVLVACLENPRERLTLLQFEDQIVRFLRSPRDAQLAFPPLSSFHRLIIHRLADRCGLEHPTGDYTSPYSNANDNNAAAARGVTLFKTPRSAVPSVLLIDLSSAARNVNNTQQQQQSVGGAGGPAAASVPKIMVRKRAGPRPGATGGRNSKSDAKNAQQTMQDRERAYAEARARIFGDAASADATAEATPAAAPPTSARTISPVAGLKGNANSQQASGPDGSRGFNGRGRGATPPLPAAALGTSGSERLLPRQQTIHAALEQSRPRDAAAAAAAPSSSSSSTVSRDAARVPVQSTHDWKESKVLWRNREQELNDPDFTRHHHHQHQHHRQRASLNNNSNSNEYSRYAPPQQMHSPHHPIGRYSSSSNGGIGNVPATEYYDNAVAPPPHLRQPPSLQAFGYLQSQPQPPLPMPPMPPGPPLMAMMSGRGSGSGGYHHPHGQQPHSSQYNSNSSRTGYNDDFPPLGQ